MDEKIIKLVNDSEKELDKEFKKIDEICEYNSLKVLNAFWNNKLSEAHFSQTTGYGYDDIGRDVIEKIYAEIFGAEDALVRSQFISGSHALTVALFAYLRPSDTMLSISGLPYDTLHEVIGIVPNDSSLKSFGVNYEQIDLVNDDFDYEKIEERLNKSKIKLIDIIVGTLIKNLGGGIAPNGAYIAGKKRLVDLAGERLTLPGEGREVGPTLGINKQILEGLFFSPSVVASALKTAVLASKVLEELGYKVEPRYNDERVDIVQNIEFGKEEDLVKYCQGIQMASPVDSFAIPMPWDMPGYEDKVIMAAGTFTQGSSIELSCDGPIRKPYIAYMQGSLTYEYGKIAIIKAVSNLTE